MISAQINLLRCVWQAQTDEVLHIPALPCTVNAGIAAQSSRNCLWVSPFVSGHSRYDVDRVEEPGLGRQPSETGIWACYSLAYTYTIKKPFTSRAIERIMRDNTCKTFSHYRDGIAILWFSLHTVVPCWVCFSAHQPPAAVLRTTV